MPKKIPLKQRRIKKMERKKMKRIKVNNFQKLPFVHHFTRKNYLFFSIQGPRRLSVQSKLALTERNMHADIFLKMVLKS